MANSGFRLPRVGGLPGVKTGQCPGVADLIDYAQGHLGADDRHRVETHLKESNCRHCQSWIAKVLPPTDPHGNPPSSDPSRSAASPNPKWQRLAFRDLEERLRQLEEGT